MTLNRAQCIASECEKELTSVTYDLATENAAKKFQLLDQYPKYDNAFWNIGVFHFEMVFFCAMGKYIAKFGRPESLNQSRISENVSLKRFGLKIGYNTCRRINQILPAVMEIMPFRNFESKFKNVSLSVIKDELKFIKEVLHGYLLFSRDDLEGKYGLTT